MRHYITGAALLAATACVTGKAIAPAQFGPGVSLQPSIKDVAPVVGGGYNMKLDLPAPAYVAAVSVYPKRRATILGIFDSSDSSGMLASGSQGVTVKAVLESKTYESSAGPTQADWARCMKYVGAMMRCDDPTGYIIIVASRTPFDATAVDQKMTAVDLDGSAADVVLRVADAVAQSTDASWGAASAAVPPPGSSLTSPFGIPVGPFKIHLRDLTRQ